MGILLGFAPFILFAIVDRMAGATSGLVAGMAVSAAMVLRDWISPGRSPKMLEIGAVILFGGLALYAVLGGPTGSIFGVRLAVDAGLMLIVLFSIATRRPFTLQYAREQVAQAFWGHPAFAVMVRADLVLVYAPNVPPDGAIVSTVMALAAAITFTRWYPKQQRAKIRSLR